MSLNLIKNTELNFCPRHFRSALSYISLLHSDYTYHSLPTELTSVNNKENISNLISSLPFQLVQISVLIFCSTEKCHSQDLLS